MSYFDDDGELRLYDHRRRPLCTMPARMVKAAWQRNGASGLTWTLARSDRRYATRFIQPMNRVEYHHAALPVAWTGVLIDPADKPDNGEVEFTALGAESLYGGRFTDLWVQAIGTGGELAHAVHTQATRIYPLGIDVGEVDRSGPEYYVEYTLKNCGEAFTDLANQTGADWWIEKTGTEHRDPWLLRYSRRRGVDVSATVLLSGDVVDTPDYKQSAEKLATALHVTGGNDGQGQIIGVNVLYLYRRFQAAIDLYGLIEDRVSFDDIIDPVLLAEAADRELLRRAKPSLQLAVNLDNRRGNWGRFWIGDTIRVLLGNIGVAGLDTRAKVTGIQWDRTTGKMGLALDLADVG